MAQTFDILQALILYRPQDDADRLCRNLFIKFIESNPDCAMRSCLVGHLTGSSWLVDPSRRYVLLTEHHQLGRWLQLGGHADGDWDLSAVALREAKEESAIQEIRLLAEEIFDLDIHEIPANAKAPAHLHYDVRFIMQSESMEFTVTCESRDLRWIPISEIGLFVEDESLLRMAQKWQLFQTSALEPT